jgi:hypothetical protein
LDDRREEAVEIARRPRASRWLREAAKAGVAGLVLSVGFLAFRPVSAPERSTWSQNPDPPPGLERAVQGDFSDDACVEARAAARAVGRDLLRLDLPEWEVTWATGLTPRACAGAAIDTINERVLLLPALRPQVRAALADFGNRLLDECLTRDQATRALQSLLNGLGETGWALRTDGPIGGPLSRLDEVQPHVDAGCFIYSGTGSSADGQEVFYLGGRESE